jgi:hypothetical protein
MAEGNGSEAGGVAPLWYALGAIILIVVMMGTIVALKPLQFTAPVAAHCEGAACEHEAAPAGEPEGVSHEHAAPPAAAPEGASHEAPPHPE